MLFLVVRVLGWAVGTSQQHHMECYLPLFGRQVQPRIELDLLQNKIYGLIHNYMCTILCMHSFYPMWSFGQGDLPNMSEKQCENLRKLSIYYKHVLRKMLKRF